MQYFRSLKSALVILAPQMVLVVKKCLYLLNDRLIFDVQFMCLVLETHDNIYQPVSLTMLYAVYCTCTSSTRRVPLHHDVIIEAVIFDSASITT